MRIKNLPRALLAGSHLALAVVLVVMAAPQVPKIRDQYAVGWVPDYYPMFIALAVAPIVMSAVLVALLALWLRRGIRWPMVLADGVAWALGWWVFVIFVFGTDLAVVQAALVPVCFVVAVVVALIERRTDRTRREASRAAS